MAADETVEDANGEELADDPAHVDLVKDDQSLPFAWM